MTLRRFLPTTLKAEVLFYGLISVLVVTTFVGWFDFTIAEAQARQETQSRIVQTATALKGALERVSLDEAREILDAYENAALSEEHNHVYLINARGTVVAATHRQYVGKPLQDAVAHPVPELRQVLAGRPMQFVSETQGGTMPTFSLTLPIYADAAKPNQVTGALYYEQPYTTYAILVRQSVLRFVISDLILLALFVIPLWLLLQRQVLKPVRAIVEANRAFADGRPEGMSIPASALPNNEFREIASSRRQMLIQLFEAQLTQGERLKELAALNATAALLSESLQIEEVLRRILDKVLEITGRQAAEISLRDARTGQLKVLAQRGFPSDWIHREGSRLAHCLCGEAAQQTELVSIGAEQDDARTCDLACRRAGFPSLCIVPLHAEGQVLGVMSLHGHAARPVAQTRPESDLLAAIGSQIGVALSNIHLYQEVQRLSVTDALTGLRNRHALEERLAEELRRSQRYRHSLSVIMVDIDHFKNYNDTFGHPSGDVILRDVARLLEKQTRETDFVARYGGEEFIVLLPETPKRVALEIAERIRAAVATQHLPHAGTQPGVELTISLGIAAFPDDMLDAGELVQQADRALYAAKRAGRNRVCGA